MNQQYYRELDPEKRWQILQREPDSEEKERVQELYLLRHRNAKNGERTTEQDHYLWFLVTLSISGSKRPFFVKSEAGRVLRELRKLKGTKKSGDPDSDPADVLFQKEMKNAAARFFSVSSQESGGRKLFGTVRGDENLRLSDQCVDAWRLIYGAPMYLNLEEELLPVSEAVRDAYYASDDRARQRLEELDRKRRPQKRD